MKLRVKDYEWYIIGAFAIVTFLIGVIGFYSIENQFDSFCSRLFDSFYLSLQLFVLQMDRIDGEINTYIQISRFLAPAILAYATIKSVFSLLQKDLGLMFIKNHIVICGLSNESLILLRDLLSRKIKVVLIEPSSEKNSVLNLRTEGVIWINEYPADMTALKRAKVKDAKAIFVLNERDEFNIEIVSNIYKMFGVGLTERKVLCFVHIYEPVLERIFKSHKIFKEPNDMLDARVVNIYKKGSEYLINQFPLAKENSLQNESQIRVMIMGLGRTGKSILIQVALFFHYSKDQKLKVTVIDKNAKKEIAVFRNEYPSIYDLLDLSPIETEIETLEEDNFYDLLPTGNYTAIYCCAGEDILRISVVNKILTKLQDVKVFVSLRKNSDLTRLIDEGDIFKNEKRIQIFNLYEQTCTYEQLVNEEVETLARAIHGKYCETEKLKGISKEQNPSIAEWDDLPESLKEANRQQAFYIKLKLETFGYRLVPLEEPENAVDPSTDPELLEKMSRAEHIRWVDEKLLNGWKYGPGPKNVILKTHPDIIPYEELDEPGKEKDRNTIRNLPYLLNVVGKKIIRK